MAAKLLAYFIIAAGIFYFCVMIREYIRRKEDRVENKAMLLFYAVAEIGVWFLASFGVSDTAVNSLIYPINDTVEVKKLPGTFVVGATLPMCVMSFSYITSFKVSAVTLFALVLAQALGSFLGASIVSKLNSHVLSILMGGALMATGLILLAKNILLNVPAGDAIGLPPVKLAIAFAIIFTTGMLNMIGFGSTTPNMAALLLLGVGPLAVYPIVMSANVFTCLAGCVSFIKQGVLHFQVTLLEMFMGVFGVLLAMKFFASINTNVLQILMVLVMMLSAVQLFYKDYKKQKALKS